MTVTPWTPAEIDQLRKLVAEGKINREIAAIMGRGLSSVVGARFRNGLRAKESRAWAVLSQLADMGLVCEGNGIWGATTKGREMVAEMAA